MQFDNTADYISSDDVQARIEELKELMGEASPDTGLDENDRAELEALCAFQSECESNCSDWEYGDTAIHESAFQAHIEQLINDCYELPKSSDWPYRHLTLDLEAAANEARSDYTEIDFCGETYLVR